MPPLPLANRAFDPDCVVRLLFDEGGGVCDTKRIARELHAIWPQLSYAQLDAVTDQIDCDATYAAQTLHEHPYTTLGCRSPCIQSLAC